MMLVSSEYFSYICLANRRLGLRRGQEMLCDARNQTTSMYPAS